MITLVTAKNYLFQVNSFIVKDALFLNSKNINLLMWFISRNQYQLPVKEGIQKRTTTSLKRAFREDKLSPTAFIYVRNFKNSENWVNDKLNRELIGHIIHEKITQWELSKIHLHMLHWSSKNLLELQCNMCKCILLNSRWVGFSCEENKIILDETL